MIRSDRVGPALLGAKFDTEQERVSALAEWHALLLENLADTEGDLLDRIVTHAGLSGPEQTFLSARLAPPTRQHRCCLRAGPTPVNQMQTRAGGRHPDNADRNLFRVLCATPRRCCGIIVV